MASHPKYRMVAFAAVLLTVLGATPARATCDRPRRVS